MKRSPRQLQPFCRWGMIAACMFLSPSLSRAVETTLGVAALVEKSEVVAHVEIIDFSNTVIKLPRGKFPFVVYRARVKKLLMGAGPEIVFIQVPGLIGEKKVMASVDDPVLRPGGEFVLFLHPAPGSTPGSGVYRLSGSSQGVLAAATRSQGQEPVVLAPVRGKAGSTAPARILLKLSDLGAQVTAVRENLARKEKGK